MSSQRTLISAICLAAAALATAAPASAAVSPSPAQKMSATSHGTTVQANLFTSCQTLTGADGVSMGVCADGIPSPTAKRLPVSPRGTVAITVGAPVREISARYAAKDGSGGSAELKIAPIDASGQRFSIALPSTKPAALLLISTRYEDLPTADGRRESGDAHFSVGLAHHRVTPRRVTAHASITCRTTTGGERRCRLAERGTVVLAAGATGCRDGRVRVRVLARGRRVLHAIVRTKADCRYEVPGRAFGLPSAGVARVVVATRFLGSPALAARNAPDVRVRVR